MKIIGVVGGMGAGKTTVVSLIQQLKRTFVISADQIGHQILLKDNLAYDAVVKSFGKEILSDDEEIIREKLGQIVFKDYDKLQQLNQITHPLIYEEVVKQMNTCLHLDEHELIVIEAALLVESRLIELTDKIIAVYADEAIRIERVIKRQGLSKEEVLARFRAQKKWEELTHIADGVIDNSLSIENTKIQIKKLLAHL